MLKTDKGTLPDDWQSIEIFDDIHKPKHYESEVNLMAKHNEAVYIYDGYVYKWFSDPTRCLSRIARKIDFGCLVPNIIRWTSNWFKYRYVKGDILTNRTDLLVNYLNSMELLCWKKSYSDDHGWAQRFYVEKTMHRVHKYNNSYVNGWLSSLKFDDVRLTRTWHGDCSFENIVWDGLDFILLDWREDYHGDVYYDLAKLIKSVYFNHLTLDDKGNWKGHDPSLRTVIYDWAQDHGYDVKELKKVYAVAVLAMSGSHEEQFGWNLFQWGKSLISETW